MSEISKTDLTGISVALSIEESYGFHGFQGINRSFSGKNQISACGWDADAEVGALLRFTGCGAIPGVFPG